MFDKFKLIIIAIIIALVIMLISAKFGSNFIVLVIIAFSIFEALRRVYIRMKKGNKQS